MDDDLESTASEEGHDNENDENGGGLDVRTRENLVDQETPLLPKLGMVFNSEEEAFQFFVAYGCRTGFGITRRSNNSFDGFRYRSIFICSKGGQSRLRPGATTSTRKQGVKTDCKAKMVVKDHHFQNRWEVIDLHLEHNHPLDPSLYKFRRSSNSCPSLMNETGITMSSFVGTAAAIPAGSGGEELSIFLNDHRNRMDRNGKLQLVVGDLKALVEYFDRKQGNNPSFFYCLDMNERGQLRNAFWADARSRSAYYYFNDVIDLKVTDFSNLLLATFFGVNHHMQPVLLGCALVCSRSIETYTWLLSTWMRCMSNRPPTAIITNYCHDLEFAIRKVFPDAHHRFCLGHILKELEGIEGNDMLIFEFRKVVLETLTASDFEKEWQRFIQLFQLEGKEWFSKLFQVRRHWAPVYVKEVFWAGLSITEKNDTLHDYLENSFSSVTSVKSFLDEYDAAMKAKMENEAQRDLQSLHDRPVLLSSFTVEDPAARAYTPEVFDLFQLEIKQLFQLSCFVIDRRGSVVSYVVTENLDGKNVDYRVSYDSSEENIVCLCRLFQHKGIQCRHALCVFRQELVLLLPPKYIIPRWRRDFKCIFASASLPLPKSMKEASYYDLYRSGHHYLMELLELGALKPESKDYILSVLKEMRDKVISFEKSLQDQRVDRDAASTNPQYNPFNEEFTDDPSPITLTTKGWDGMQLHPRGRPRKKKIASPAVLDSLKKRKKRAPSKPKNSAPSMPSSGSNSNENNVANHVQMSGQSQVNEGWSLAIGGTGDAFPYVVENISFDIAQFSGGPNFQWPESSRSRLL